MEGIEGYDPIENLATGLQTITNEGVHLDRVIRHQPGNQNASSDKGPEISVEKRKSKLSRSYHREKRNEANQSTSSSHQNTAHQNTDDIISDQRIPTDKSKDKNPKQGADQESTDQSSDQAPILDDEQSGWNTAENLQVEEEQEYFQDEVLFIEKDSLSCKTCGEGFQYPNLLERHQSCTNIPCKDERPEHDHRGLMVKVPFVDEKVAESYLKRKFPEPMYKYDIRSKRYKCIYNSWCSSHGRIRKGSRFDREGNLHKVSVILGKILKCN